MKLVRIMFDGRFYWIDLFEYFWSYGWFRKVIDILNYKTVFPKLRIIFLSLFLCVLDVVIVGVSGESPVGAFDLMAENIYFEPLFNFLFVVGLEKEEHFGRIIH
jgi:hypothetical protein